MKKPSLATPLCFAVAALLAFASTPAAEAVTYTWDGGGNDNYFSNHMNWAANSAPPFSGLTSTDLHFAGNLRLTPNASTAYSMRSLIFDSGAGPFTISGSTLTIGTGGIVNHGTTAQRINNNVTLAADQSWNFANRGALSLHGSVLVQKSLTVAGGEIYMNGSYFTIEDTTASNAAVFNLTGGALSTNAVAVGYGGSGVVNHSAGSFNVSHSHTLYVGRDAGSTGTYNLSGSGQLAGAYMSVGYNGSGTFNQTGGSVEARENLNIGSYAGGLGTYNQSAGTVTAKSLEVGRDAGGSGVYKLSGGSLNTGFTYLAERGGTASFTQSGGTHRATSGLRFGSFFGGGSGTYNLDGGVLATPGVRHNSGGATFNFNGGTLRATNDNVLFLGTVSATPTDFVANVRDGGAVIDTQGFNVEIGHRLAHSNIAGDNAIDGGLTKTGSGTLTLLGTNTYTGGTTVSGGILRVAADENLGAATGAVTLQNSSRLVFTEPTISERTYNLNNGTANFGGSQLWGATVNGGFVAGNVTLAVSAASEIPTRFAGVTMLPGSTLTVRPGGATLDNTTIRGGLNVTDWDATLALQNGFITGSGSLTVGSGFVDAPAMVNTTGMEIQGVTTINSAGTIANSGGSLYLTGGSRTTIHSGGTLSAASGSTVELNGSLLTNNGTQSGVLNVNYGSTAKGAGTFGTVNVGDGGKFSPGNSPGTATVEGLSLGSGGSYVFELNSANATPGAGADFINNLGNLDIAAGTTANSVFTIAIVSLNSAGQSAALTDFDAGQPYTFTLVTSAGGITGFDAREFAIDASGFVNDLQGGSFSIAQDGNDLVVNFAPVPEPSTWASLAFGALLLVGVNRWRRPSR